MLRICFKGVHVQPLLPDLPTRRPQTDIQLNSHITGIPILYLPDPCCSLLKSWCHSHCFDIPKQLLHQPGFSNRSMKICLFNFSIMQRIFLPSTRPQVVRMGSKVLPDRPLAELAVLQGSTPLCHGFLNRFDADPVKGGENYGEPRKNGINRDNELGCSSNRGMQ